MINTYLSIAIRLLNCDEIAVSDYISEHCPSDVCNRKRVPKFGTRYCTGDCVECWNKAID